MKCPQCKKEAGWQGKQRVEMDVFYKPNGKYDQEDGYDLIWERDLVECQSCGHKVRLKTIQAKEEQQ